MGYTPPPHPSDPFVRAALTGVAAALPADPTPGEIDRAADTAVRLGRATQARQDRASDTRPIRVTED